MEDVASLLTRLSAHVPAADKVTPMPCADTNVVANVPAEQKAVWLGRPIVFLSSTLDDSLTPFSTLPLRKSEDVWGWPIADDIDAVLDPSRRRIAEGDYGRHLGGIAGLRYLVVLKASRRRLPRALRDGQELPGHGGGKRRLASGVDFEPGEFHGGAFVMDVRRASVVCQAPLDVSSSAHVDYATRGPYASAPGKALVDDFQDCFLKAERSALRRISRVARVSR